MGSGMLFCLSRPEALRAEAKVLHAAADCLDPPSSDEDERHCAKSLGHAAPHPLRSPLVRREGAKHPRFREARFREHGDKPDVAPRVRATGLR